MKYACKMFLREHIEYHLQSKETKEKRANKNRGRKRTEETKQKLSIAKLGDLNPNKNGNVRRGAIITQEHRIKQSNKMKGKIPWNKGLTKDDPRVRKYIETRYGIQS